MSVNFVAYIVGRHGYSSFSKHLFRSSFRQYATSKLQKKKTKVVAAASATCVAENIDHNDTSKINKIIPDIIGQKRNADSEILVGPKDCNEFSIKASQINLDSKHKNPHAYIDDFRYIGLTKHKEPAQPQDDTVSTKRRKLKPVYEITDFDSKSRSLSEDKKPMTLVNALKSTDLQWRKQVISPRLLLKHYMALSKIRLTGLVVLTTAAGYGMAYAPFEPLTFLYAVVGTALMSASANATNQILEVPYDAQMARTKNRVLIRGYLTPLHATVFATCASALGISILYVGVNPITAGLGALNLLLYTSIYTPLKRCSIVNTWVGSVVGAIPPVMGWAACTGSVNASALLMGAILYSWQFPHFNALSWNLRPDYSRAGYRMMSVVNPDLCRKTALRHSIAILVFCSMAPLMDLTTWSFPIDSFPLNCYFIYCSWKFYNNADSQSSRKLFRLSLIHLPGLMFLLFVGKKYASESESSIDLMNL